MLHPRQNGLELPVLLGSGSVERCGLRAELDVDGLAFGLVGPFEIRAVAFGGIVVAGALLLAALHHPLQDGSLQEIMPPRCLVWVAMRSTGRCRQNLIRWQSVSADQREALPQPQASRSWFSFDRTVLVFVLVLKPRPVYAWLRCRSLPNWASDGCRMRTKIRGACVMMGGRAGGCASDERERTVSGNPGAAAALAGQSLRL